MLSEVAPTNDEKLPACTPSLMPFHISYSGPAPISRYLRPKPAPPSSSSIQSSSTATLVLSSSSNSVLTESNGSITTLTSTTSIGSFQENECEDDVMSKMNGVKSSVEQAAATCPLADIVDVPMEVGTDTQPLDDTSTPNHRAPKHAERFLAAFRGRQMYGQAVDIPVGYGGLVLRAPLDSKVKARDDAKVSLKPVSQKPKPKSKTRRSKRTTVDDTAEEPDGEDNGGYCSDTVLDLTPPTRRLIPSSTFTSFMLWTPDRPLDEGRDEYVRALAEWTKLASEIHSCDE